MKRLLSFFTACIAAVCVFGQYTPTTQWPYLYEDFQEGTIYYSSNSKGTATINVHLINSELHFLKDDNIFKANAGDIVRVEVGADAFIFVDNKLMKIIGEENHNLLLKLTEANIEALFSGGTGAYGASSNTHSRRDLSSLNIQVGGINITNHALMMQNKKEGKELDLEDTYYFIIDNQTFEATRKNTEKHLTAEQRTQWKVFTKENKIKWKKEEGLLQVLSFF